MAFRTPRGGRRPIAATRPFPAACRALAACLALAAAAGARLGAVEPAAAHFDQAIAPLLLEHCAACHAGDQPKGGLDLTRHAAARAGGDNGPAIVPGRPDASLLWQRVAAKEMPPDEPLPEAARAALRAWIASGAAWGVDPLDPLRHTTSKRAGADWWSLRPIVRPPAPALHRPPLVDTRASFDGAAWARQPIDLFVAAKLREAGLTPSPEAERRVLIRRLWFDLLGLPPDPEEPAPWLADDAPNLVERLVEHLLASPHYGERWARHWLDVVRYGETDGFERNARRPNAWHYRDWVIRAFNEDLPYDEFCRLQIAGDALRPGAADGVRALGYLAAGVHNTVVPQNAAARELAAQDELEDLVGNVGQTFLGLTVNCARCHDHKFDPITSKEYYQLAAALSGVRPGEREVVSSEAEQRLRALEPQVDALRRRAAAIDAPMRTALLAEKQAAAKQALTKPVAEGERPRPDATAAAPAPILAWDFRQGGKDLVRGLEATPLGGARFTEHGLVVDGQTAHARSAPLPVPLREKTLEAWVRLADLNQRGGGALTVQTPDGAAFDAIVFGEREPGQWMAGSDFFRRTASFSGPVETDADTRETHVAIVYAADGTITGYRQGQPYGRAYNSNGPLPFEAGKAVVSLGIRHDPAGGNRMLAGLIVRARVYDRALRADEIAASAADGAFVSDAEVLARLAPEARAERDGLAARLAALEADIALARRQRAVKVYTATFRQPPDTRVLRRGQVTAPGEVVSAGGVAALAALSSDFHLPPGAPEAERRRALAEWLSSRQNPLFARVMVNRLWRHHFGRGLVDTPSDFGFNGGRPSHPELLDWLAAEFVASGFSIKRVQRLILTSAAYRQDARPRPEALRVDADNRWLWRAAPRRLEGEALRDAALAVGGLLNRELGGPGFSDYEISDGRNGTTYYDPRDPAGPEYHRRGVYRFVPRGGNQGLLDLFDCPDPAASTPKRNVTTTPLQALSLWNGAFALRMADALAARAAREAGSAQADEPTTAAAVRAFELALQRPPTAEERAAARALAIRHGLPALCRALLNANEFVIVE